MNTKNSPLQAVNKSGFLFQQYIESEVIKAGELGQTPWDVCCVEHRWIDRETGEENFIDLILGHGRVRAVIESKRFKDGSWIFLTPETSSVKYNAQLCWLEKNDPEASIIIDWRTVNNRGIARESMYCVSKHDSGSSSTMENIAAPLLRSVESLAMQDARALKPGQHMFYIPVIVTTAQLYVCQYSMQDISSLGELSDDKAKCEPVGYVQFTKSLSTTLRPGDDLGNLAEINSWSQRTVFVVNISSLIEWLKLAANI